MHRTEFDIQLDKELEKMKILYPGISFIPWQDVMTETCVVTVIPDTSLDSDEFAEAEMDLCKRMFLLFPDMVITFRSKDDEYFPCPIDELNKITEFVSLRTKVLSKQAICNSLLFEGFEKIQLVSENSLLDSFEESIKLLAPKPLINHTEEAFHQGGETNYSFAA